MTTTLDRISPAPEAEARGVPGVETSAPPIPKARVIVTPITDADLDAVGSFLAETYPPDTGTAEWGNAWRASVNGPHSGAPNHGFMLRVDSRIVGAYTAMYSTRLIAGRRERFCNGSVWAVEEGYRLHSLRLLRALLAQPGWHFTDLAPSPTVQRLNQRMGFEYLDTTMALVPALPWPGRNGVRISSDPAVIDRTLSGPALAHYRDHARCRWANHLVLTDGDRACYVQWRKQPRRGLDLFATVQHVSDPDQFRPAHRQLGSWFLRTQRVLGIVVECRIAGGPIRASWRLRGQPKRMFKSSTLTASHIDYLYSELTAAP